MAQVLDRHRVALLRHDRADLHEGVRARRAGRPRSSVQNCRSWIGRPRWRNSSFDRRIDAGDVVDGGDAAVGILQRRGEAEKLGHALRGRAGSPMVVIAAAPIGQRSTIARAAAQPLDVAQQHLDHRAEIVAEGRGLRRLAVGIGDDERVALALGHVEQRVEQRGELGQQARRAAPSAPSLNSVWSMSLRDCGRCAAGRRRRGRGGGVSSRLDAGRRNPRRSPV